MAEGRTAAALRKSTSFKDLILSSSRDVSSRFSSRERDIEYDNG